MLMAGELVQRANVTIFISGKKVFDGRENCT